MRGGRLCPAVSSPSPSQPEIPVDALQRGPPRQPRWAPPSRRGLLPPGRAGRGFALPLGDHREAFVDAHDIAAVAATALSGDGHAGRSYEVTGPRALSFPDALEIIGRAAGRSIRYRGTADAYRAAQAALGFPAEQTEQEIAAFAPLRETGDAQPNGVVREFTGREPTGLRGQRQAGRRPGRLERLNQIRSRSG
jgi:uncharacterized protein YbjT (DUF2867 family)